MKCFLKYANRATYLTGKTANSGAQLDVPFVSEPLAMGSLK